MARRSRNSRGKAVADAIRPDRTTTHDPISMGRPASRAGRGLLDNSINQLSRSLEAREDTARSRQSRLDAVVDGLAEAQREAKARRYRIVAQHNDAHAAAQARLQQAIKDTPSRPNQVRASDYGSLASQQTRAKKQVKEPDIKRSPDKVRDGPTCKERPKHNRGGGGSRSFVPWCGRKS